MTADSSPTDSFDDILQCTARVQTKTQGPNVVILFEQNNFQLVSEMLFLLLLLVINLLASRTFC